MQNKKWFKQNYAVEQFRGGKHNVRRIIKYFYLNNLLNNVIYQALDVGCGAYKLLANLSSGSLGLELNPFLIKELTSLT